MGASLVCQHGRPVADKRHPRVEAKEHRRRDGVALKDGTLEQNAMGVTLTGCSLGERISETGVLRKDGNSRGPLAMVAIDNVGRRVRAGRSRCEPVIADPPLCW